jgi:hypothetical protein
MKATRKVPATMTLIMTKMIITLMVRNSGSKVFFRKTIGDERHQKKT